MNRIAVAAGACVLASYLVGSVPLGYLRHRARLRRDLERVHDTAPPRRRVGWPVELAEAAVVLAAATVAWRVVASVSPGHGSPRISAGVAAFSDQVLVPWQSVALWAGMAAALGQIAPLWLDFRGRSGVAAAVALLGAFSPVGLLGATAGYGVGLGAGRSGVVATGVAAVALVGTAWVAWAADLRALWGVPNGPETCLWSAALGAALFSAARAGRAWEPGSGPASSS